MTHEKMAIYSHYKKTLKRLGDKSNNRVRFLVIEYQCSFAKIEPIDMAVDLMKDGYEIIFDDSSISWDENVKKRKRVESCFTKEAQR